MEKEGNILIELNLYAKAYYSGAEYNEVVFITPQDYIKYFGSSQDTDSDTFEDYVKGLWNGMEVYVGELDGKHSEVCGYVEVDFWDADRIAEYWEQPSNDGEYLLDKIGCSIVPDEAQYKKRHGVITEIQNNIKELVESIGTKVTVSCRVPKDKVEELNAFVKKLNER